MNVVSDHTDHSLWWNLEIVSMGFEPGILRCLLYNYQLRHCGYTKRLVPNVWGKVVEVPADAAESRVRIP